MKFSIKNIFIFLLFFVVTIIFMLSSQSSFNEEESLKEVFSDYFEVGTIWHGKVLGDPERSINKNLKKEKELTIKEFNSITAENCMKPEFIQPSEGYFTFEEADQMISFAEKNDMSIVGHTLVWHHMTPKWFFKDSEGNQVSREVLIDRMKNHIKTVVSRYKGKVDYWDVVNEVIHTKKNEEGIYEAFFRSTPWYNIIGPEYIEIAYRTVMKIDPNAKLLYNDFNLDQEAKIDFAINLVKSLKEKGIPIHAIGYQAHFMMDEPLLSNIEMVFKKCKEAQIPIHITELDLSVLPNAWHLRGDIVSLDKDVSGSINPYANFAPPDVLEAQAVRYRNIFKIFLEYHEILERVTFWGVWDGASWRDYSPIKGRTDYPLFFDRKFNKKVSYDKVCSLLEQKED